MRPDLLENVVPTSIGQAFLENVKYMSDDLTSLLRYGYVLGGARDDNSLRIRLLFMPETTSQFQTFAGKIGGERIDIIARRNPFNSEKKYTIDIDYENPDLKHEVSPLRISWRGVSPTEPGMLDTTRSYIASQWNNADDETRKQIIKDIAAALELAKRGADLRDGDEALLNELNKRRCVRI